MERNDPLLSAFRGCLRVAVDLEGMTSVAKRAGVSVQTVSGWLNGGKVPSLTHAGKVALAIGFDLGPHNS